MRGSFLSTLSSGSSHLLPREAQNSLNQTIVYVIPLPPSTSCLSHVKSIKIDGNKSFHETLFLLLNLNVLKSLSDHMQNHVSFDNPKSKFPIHR